MSVSVPDRHTFLQARTQTYIFYVKIFLSVSAFCSFVSLSLLNRGVEQLLDPRIFTCCCLDMV